MLTTYHLERSYNESATLASLEFGIIGDFIVVFIEIFLGGLISSTRAIICSNCGMLG